MSWELFYKNMDQSGEVQTFLAYLATTSDDVPGAKQFHYILTNNMAIEELITEKLNKLVELVTGVKGKSAHKGLEGSLENNTNQLVGCYKLLRMHQIMYTKVCGYNTNSANKYLKFWNAWSKVRRCEASRGTEHDCRECDKRGTALKSLDKLAPIYPLDSSFERLLVHPGLQSNGHVDTIKRKCGGTENAVEALKKELKNAEYLRNNSGQHFPKCRDRVFKEYGDVISNINSIRDAMEKCPLES